MPWWLYWVLAFAAYVVVLLGLVKVIGALIRWRRGDEEEESEDG